jgi:hypothetical protein
MENILDRLDRLAQRREMEGNYTDSGLVLAAKQAIVALLNVASETVNQTCIVSHAIPDIAEIGRYSGKDGDTMRGHFLAAKDRAQQVHNTYWDGEYPLVEEAAN